MRIALVLDRAVVEHADPVSPFADEQGVHVGELAAALTSAGHNVTVHTRRDAPDLPDRVTTVQGYTVVHTAAGPATPLTTHELLPVLGTFGSHLQRDWTQNRPDVVHAHSWTSGIATQLAARDLALPAVQTFHTLGVVARGRRTGVETELPERIRIERMLARGAVRVIAACSDHVREVVRMGVPRARVSVVPPGVDLVRGAVSGEDDAVPGQARERVVAAGRWVPKEGFDVAIAALVSLQTTELIIAGTPACGDAETHEVARLLGIAERLGVRTRVRLVDRMTRDDVPALFRSADVALCPSLYESSGTVALEAMACGRPVVASAVGSLQDIVVDGVTGLLVPPDSPQDLAVALRDVLIDEVRRGAFGVAGRDRAATRYSWERAAADTARVYAQACGGPVHGVSSVVPLR